MNILVSINQFWSDPRHKQFTKKIVGLGPGLTPACDGDHMGLDVSQYINKTNNYDT
jgi:hypothetical protein